ncbi:MAG: hypothetical protein GY777_29265 [Candidatus Brocadiaceae bacterium]|nr:hypothetical protein [Candidatus Brocadiaceae bacterium]
MNIDNEKGIPFQDQWVYLSSIKKIPYARVSEIVDKALANHSIMDVRFSSMEEDEGEE